MSIGSFARRSGLTSSALRFYADAGLILPAQVDSASGYRFYGEDQLERAVVLRQLREIGIPLATAKSVLNGEPDEAIHLIDEHIDAVAKNATTARQQAAAIKTALTGAASAMVVAMSGPVLAAAIDQVLSATTDEPGIAVLGGVHFEAQHGAVVVTATDRYRLSTRTLVTTTPVAIAWAATANGDDLRSCLTDLRRTPKARIEATDHGMWMRLPNRDDGHCRLLTGPFPDYRSMLDDMPAVTTRAQVSTAVLLQSLEEKSADLIGLHVSDSCITVRNTLSNDGIRLPASVSGTAVEVWFEMTTLYPAISAAIGADVLIDLRGHSQPATVRSADHGDLTTVAMPTMPPATEELTAPKEHHP
ncbi:MerR family transcriptional regulator [Rhodococcus sp. H29-C3]|nr:MerR family transcriptional regulator [Rhodococcus sp. H29-C3]